jgi:hypothetical protein
MIRILTSLFAVLITLAGPARAEAPLLVELFASKNCVSCPKAYETLKSAAEKDSSLVLLTWPVSYWDYLGGREKMALPESEDRQRNYAERFRLRGPYTPQTVFGGTAQCAGNRAKKVENAIDEARKAAPAPATLKASGNGFELAGNPQGLTDLWLVHFLSGSSNTTRMPNPVTRVENLGPWLGGKRTLEKPKCDKGCVLIVQEAGFGRVLAVHTVRP